VFEQARVRVLTGTTAAGHCQGVQVRLAAGGRIGGSIRMTVRLAQSLLDCGGFNPSDDILGAPDEEES
jgi:hypothetical protein